MKKLTLILIAIIGITFHTNAQNPQWLNYTNGDKVYALAEEGNNMWAGTNGGLVKLDKTTGSPTFYNKTNSGLPSNLVYSIAFDENGTKWIGTFDGGLAAVNGTNWTIYDTLNSDLPSNWVSSIAIDENSTKWIGTYGGGLAAFDGTNWAIYDTSNSGLPNNWVGSIAIDENSTKWIGSNGGLTEFNGTNWTNYNTSNSGLPSNGVNSIAFDENDTKWIGTYGGLAEFDGINWTIYNTSNSGLPYNYVNTITIDENSTKWIGTGGGLAAFNENGIPVHVEEFKIERNDLKIYPNPTNDHVFLSLNISTSASIKICLYNTVGICLKNQQFRNEQSGPKEFKLDLKNVPAGVYLCRAQVGSQLFVKKIIKN